MNVEEYRGWDNPIIIEAVQKFTIKIPSGPRALQDLIDEMIEEDPEISTGNYGNPGIQWLTDLVIQWLIGKANNGGLSALKAEALVEEGDTEWRLA